MMESEDVIERSYDMPLSYWKKVEDVRLRRSDE